MAINIKRIEDRKAWEDVLKKFDYTTMFLSWEWGEFERSSGKDFESWGIYKNDVLVGVLPIKTIRAKRGKYLHVRHAPLIDWGDTNVVKEVISFLKEKSKEKKVYFVRISPLIRKSEENEEKLESLGFKRSPIHATDAQLTVVLDLTKSEDQILMEMRKTTRNLIRRAQKIDIKVKHTEDIDLFDDFKKIYLDTVKRQGWTAYSIEYIEKEYEMFRKVGKAHMFVSYYEDKPISSSIFIVHNDQVIYHFSGSLTEYRKIPSSYLLHWEAIRFFKEKGLKIYNFWGVCPKNSKKHPWYGLSLFKRGFTESELEFVHSYDLIVSPLAYITNIFEYIETRVRGYI